MKEDYFLQGKALNTHTPQVLCRTAFIRRKKAKHHLKNVNKLKII